MRVCFILSSLGPPRGLPIKAIFVRESGAGWLLLALGIVSVLLMALEANTRLLEGSRARLNTLASPLRVVAETPYFLGGEVAGFFSSHSSMRAENEALRLELLKLSQISQQFASLRAENAQLRELLGSRRRVEHDVLVAEVIGLVPAPNRHQIIIDKGTSAAVAVGQAVIDAQGIIGQVVAADDLTAEILLLGDTQHAVPVSVNRSGVRGIVSGTGSLATLELDGISVTADVRQGDLLVSSGLGQRFPPGYPVGTVRSVQVDPTVALVRVTVEPAAELDRLRHVLVILPAERRP